MGGRWQDERPEGTAFGPQTPGRLPGGAVVVSGPARGYLNYERAAPAFSGSQMLMWRVSGMMNRQMMKQTAGTTMG
jgi:hypothetical protein